MQSTPLRRNFLRALGSGSLAAVITLLSGRATAASAKDVPATEPKQSCQGYQLSEHVRTYYRTTRL